MTGFDDLAGYAAGQGTTGLLVRVRGRTVLEENFPLGEGEADFSAAFVRGSAAGGALREDVASQQKSLIALLAGQAMDRGLLDVERSVAEIIGPGWSKSGTEAEAAITVRHLLEMNSGLTDPLETEAAPGARFHYNTPAYARLQRVLEAVAGQPLNTLTRDWLTGPLGMADTEWLPRPAELARMSGNAWGLVTAPRDLARLGEMVLARGVTSDGARVISQAALARIFTPTATNPSYGWLWWLNGGGWSLGPGGERREGRFVAAAPTDALFALGAQGRLLGLVPSLELLVVRLGRQPQDAAFAEEFWRRLMAAA